MMHALWEYDFVKPVGTRILGLLRLWVFFLGVGLLRSDRCGFVVAGGSGCGCGFEFVI